MSAVYPMVTQNPDDTDPHTLTPTETVDPAASAVEAYIEGTTGDGGDAGFPWVALIGFLAVMVAVFVVAVRLRRRFG